MRTLCESLWKSLDDDGNANKNPDAILLLHHYPDWAIARSRARTGKSRVTLRLPGGDQSFSEAIGKLRDRIPEGSDRTESVILIEPGAEWRYLPSDWYTHHEPSATDFDDADWKKGWAELGFGEAGETTTPRFGGEGKPPSVWLRHEFQVARS